MLFYWFFRRKKNSFCSCLGLSGWDLSCQLDFCVTGQQSSPLHPCHACFQEPHLSSDSQKTIFLKYPSKEINGQTFGCAGKLTCGSQMVILYNNITSHYTLFSFPPYTSPSYIGHNNGHCFVVKHGWTDGISQCFYVIYSAEEVLFLYIDFLSIHQLLEVEAALSFSPAVTTTAAWQHFPTDSKFASSSGFQI